MSGEAVAFVGEFGVTAILMSVVLLTMRSQRLRAYTGLCAAAILALAISLESPLSGTGLDPARTLATSAISGIWSGWWIYFLAPPAGMLLAAQCFGRESIPCAKLAHDTGRPCRFRTAPSRHSKECRRQTRCNRACSMERRYERSISFPGLSGLIAAGGSGVTELRRASCTDLVAAQTREWLVTNGLGSFASGTVAGIQTRRYHGLLIAALRPPGGRTFLVSKLEETLTCGELRFDLGANRWASGALGPVGFKC